MSHDFSNAVKTTDAEASFEQKQLYNLQLTIKGLVEFIIDSLEEFGIDGLNELVNPSLDDLCEVISQLEVVVRDLGSIELQQLLFSTRILIDHIKQKDPALCAQGTKILKGANVFAK